MAAYSDDTILLLIFVPECLLPLLITARLLSVPLLESNVNVTKKYMDYSLFCHIHHPVLFLASSQDESRIAKL